MPKPLWLFSMFVLKKKGKKKSKVFVLHVEKQTLLFGVLSLILLGVGDEKMHAMFILY